MPNPTGHSLLEQGKHATVALDHLPRVTRYSTTYDDGSSGETQHVLYWEGELVRSMEASAWLILRGPLPNDPTQAQIDAAIAALQAATQQATTDALALRQQVLADLQSAVGVPFGGLNNTQLRAIVEALAWKASALNRDTTVRPPADWLR